MYFVYSLLPFICCFHCKIVNRPQEFKQRKTQSGRLVPLTCLPTSITHAKAIKCVRRNSLYNAITTTSTTTATTTVTT
ncbi:hypothetical protein E2C01_092933 [Portunus trituberculatus]|uniref:Uncharacterized protein n=1 Tax=Portunus trituberculatus TaxID=210409 RepID=A0A5B7JHR6_PORTR|nr:hypothetical protein [Portunus trituberculatus]